MIASSLSYALCEVGVWVIRGTPDLRIRGEAAA